MEQAKEFFSKGLDATKGLIQNVHMPNYSDALWFVGVPILFVILAIASIVMGLHIKYTRGLYQSTQCSVNQLLTIRRQIIGTSIDPTRENANCVSAKLIQGTAPYKSIPTDASTGSARALVNWRPLTVRLAGYLGGASSVADGVFDMEKGIKSALHVGARSFIFDIDYLEITPCKPAVMYRDANGILRSLNTGDISKGLQTLTQHAFDTNYDPVMIVVYLRRLPPGKKQQTAFFQAIAQAFQTGNISTYHLGSTEQGNFYNCMGEATLFSSDIMNFQKKFIVLCNYDTTMLPKTSNPTDNINYWTNARIYQSPNSTDRSITGGVTPPVGTSQTAHALVGSTQDFLNIPSANQASFIQSTVMAFHIALGAPEEALSVTQASTLLNNLGIQCVPIDVLGLALNPQYKATLSNIKSSPTLADLSTATNNQDLLSFWTYAGWSYKPMITSEGFENPVALPAASRIAGFIRPKPVVPNKPSPTMNSNGGLVSIA